MSLFILSTDWRFKDRFKHHFNHSFIHCFSNIDKALIAYERGEPSLMVIDSRLKAGSHETLLCILEEKGACMPIVLCLEEGTPFSLRSPLQLCLHQLPRNLVDATTLVGYLGESAAEQASYEQCGLIGSSEAMIEVRKQLVTWAKEECSIHLYGETGTGKELAAQYLHRLTFPHRNIVSVNCSLLNDTLGNSMFFGYAKGAFTDGRSELTGLIREADGSTLFLDEVENLGLRFQAHLLRLLETGQYRRYGDTRVHTSTFRLITASNEQLDTLVDSGQLRKDFFYRISDVTITLPPLREHKEDIPALVSHYLRVVGSEKPLAKGSLDVLSQYSWPGNVRELFYVIRRAAVNCSDEPAIRIGEEDLGPNPLLAWVL
jgi:DNA-binding NtrC family response regulator